MDKQEILPEERQAILESLSKQFRERKICIENFLDSLDIDPNAIVCGSNASSLEALVQQWKDAAETRAPGVDIEAYTEACDAEIREKFIGLAEGFLRASRLIPPEEEGTVSSASTGENQADKTIAALTLAVRVLEDRITRLEQEGGAKSSRQSDKNHTLSELSSES